MRILYVISGYLPQDTGGTQMHLRDLARAMQMRGHVVAIFTRAAEGAHLAVSSDETDGVTVTRIVNDFSDVDGFERLFSHPAIDEAFARCCDAFEPDLVHVHHLTCLSTTIVEAARARRIPVVMTLHDYWMLCPRGQRLHPDSLDVCETLDRVRCLPCLNGLWPHLLPLARPAGLWSRLFGGGVSARKLRAWERDMLGVVRSCDRLIFPSRFHRDRFVDWGVDPARSRVVTHGLDAEHLRAAPRARKSVERIGYVGTVIPSKGLHTLVEAFNLLARPEIELRVHGEAPGYHGRGGYVDELRALVAPGLRATFLGRYESAELAGILAELDVLVVPSIWWEVFCLTAREAALAGVPVVASRIAGVGEAVEDGLALGCVPGDAQDLARVLAELCDDDALREEMGAKATLVRSIVDCAIETESVYGEASRA